MNAQMLELVSYLRDLVEQSAQTISGIQWMVGPAAALMFLLVALMVWRPSPRPGTKQPAKPILACPHPDAPETGLDGEVGR